jgi:hypothetical protein
VTRALRTPVLLILLSAAFAPALAMAADVRQFGAVGDGVTDDTAAIQKAVDSKTGDIDFAKGKYLVSKSVVIDLDRVGYTSISGSGTAQVVMAGPGPAFRFVGTHEGSASPATFKDNVWSNQRTPMVDAIEILGAHEEAVGIEAAGTMQLTVSRVVIRKALHGIHLVTRNRNVLIANCHIYENRGVGIYLDGVDLHQINVLGSHISYNRGGGIVFRHGNVRNLHVGTCDIEANHPPKDAPPETATANILLDCRDSKAGIGEIAITGCTIQHSHDSPDSANIRMLGASSESIREGHVAITGNVLSDVQVNIELRDVRGAAITGNTVWKGYSYDLILEHCHDVVVSGNNFDRNPRYRTGEEDRKGVLLRDCQDCILNGVQIAEVREHAGGLVLEGCRRVNVTACSVVDCDNAGILLNDCTMCRVSDCVLADERPATEPPVSLRLTGGKNNMLVNNLVTGRIEAAPDTAVVRDNLTAD